MRLEKVKTKRLEDQVIVITGASSGIGLATARLAAHQGARVVLSSRNDEVLENEVKRIRSKGGTAIWVAADVSSYEEVENIRDKALEAFGEINTWVNNAGLSIFGPLLEIPLEDERRLFDVNFWGVRHGCRVAVPELAKNGGVLINLGSEVSVAAVPLQGMYSATKHAIKAYTDTLRMEVEKADLPVAVTLVRPASIDTPFTEHAKNYLKRGAPSLPPPVFDPEVVAKAILECAVDPKRDAYIGSASRLFAYIETIAPRLADLYMQAKMFKQQAEGNFNEHKDEDESLNQVPTHEGRVRGKTKGHVSKSSLYTKATVGSGPSRKKTASKRKHSPRETSKVSTRQHSPRH